VVGVSAPAAGWENPSGAFALRWAEEEVVGVGWHRLLVAGSAGLVLAGVLAGCPAGSQNGAQPEGPARSLSWASVDLSHFVGPGSRPDVTTVAPLPAATDARWLLAGAAVSGPDPASSPAFWAATDLRTPTRYAAQAVSADGAASVVLDAATRPDGTTVALSNRASPVHGNQRPNVWVWPGRPEAPWREVATTRELFGGPNLVSLGNLASAPDGTFYASGTRTDDTDRQVASVWRSSDGSSWERDDIDPALASGPGELVSGRAVAAGQCGVVIVGDAIRPLPGDPAHVGGALWSSADGRHWHRAKSSSFSPPGQTSLTTTIATKRGFVAAGWSRQGSSGALDEFTSQEGRSWQHLVVTPLAAAASDALETDGAGPVLAQGPHGLILGALAGSHWLMFASSDGSHWSPLQVPPSPGDIGRPARVSLAWDGSTILAVAEGTAGSSAWTAQLS